MKREERNATIAVVIIVITICVCAGFYFNYANQRFLEKKQIVCYALDLDWDIPENYTMNIDVFTDRYIRDKLYFLDWGNNWYQFMVYLTHNEYGWDDKSVTFRFNTETGEHYIVEKITIFE